jgi:hypothetical protein
MCILKSTGRVLKQEVEVGRGAAVEEVKEVKEVEEEKRKER